MNPDKGLVFLFPGQGSQSAGMLADHLQVSGLVRDIFSEASQALGYDMQGLVADNPDGKLNQTEFTQPALLTASVALLQLWRSHHGPEAGHVAGHSLGEYSALVAAGSLEFTDAVQLVAFRGRAMSRSVASGEGKMAAILGLKDAEVDELCLTVSSTSARVWLANYNCPGQVVIAGNASVVEKAMLMAKNMGARRVLPLAVSVPSHTPLMQTAAEEMKERLQAVKLKDADRPVWSNAVARKIQDACEIRQALEQQLVQPVLWTQTVEKLDKEGVNMAIEIGPGKVLAGLTRRTARNISIYGTDTPETFKKALVEMDASHD